MRILYINNDGGGFADHIDIARNMTVEQFFNEKNCSTVILRAISM